MSANELDLFISELSTALEQEQFIKLTLSDKRNSKAELKNVYVKPVLIKAGKRLSFVYRNPSNDITKNYEYQEAVEIIRTFLTADFHQADLFSTEADWHLTHGKSTKNILKKTAAIATAPASLNHDKIKTRIVSAENNNYLFALGLTTADGKVKADMQDKYKQINKYVEIVAGIFNSASLPSPLRIYDMGSGKGYLTFALYDHLSNSLKIETHMTGVELRPALVENSNALAKKCGFDHLSFVVGSIEKTPINSADMLIALHACDTATDEAIFGGIKANSKIIICAPCCHKQIRKQLAPAGIMKEISKHGILAERLSEMITDTIRSLILEAFGYSTRVFEFISTEHTPKNVLIVGVRAETRSALKKDILKKVQELKLMYGVEDHHLEFLLKKEELL